MDRTLSSLRQWKYGIVLVIIFALLREFNQLRKTINCNEAETISNKYIVGSSFTGKLTDAGNIPLKNVIAPGELPGYTGWARPEKTLARSFSIHSTSASILEEQHPPQIQAIRKYKYVITVKCEGRSDHTSKKMGTDGKSSEEKQNGSASFFLRAYGPAVIPGSVTSRSCRGIDADSSGGGRDSCFYEFTFIFYDPGPYTIEVVLTFSHPPSIELFPLDKGSNQEPHYEGYLLPGFPLTTFVSFEEEKMGLQSLRHKKKKYSRVGVNAKENRLCEFEHIIETSATSAMEKGRWKVTGKVNEREYSSKTMNSLVVSTIGYVNNVNSLGINMEYRYINGCLILPESSFDQNIGHEETVSVSQCFGRRKKLRLLYIGDSVLRVQKDMLEKLLKGIPGMKTELIFLSLHGGYRKNQKTVEKYLKDLQDKLKAGNTITNEDEKVVIIFNTGLHDIHRLCGAEFEDERPTYIDKDQLSSGSFSCTDEYRALLINFLNVIREFPAVLKVFQTTTAAWPKYGNYGIRWNQNGQDMVLSSDFCAAFNDIAFEVLANYTDSNIHIMDGYWITYSRPDNREIGDIGNKLSHPGAEVLSVMTRKWVMMILDKVCNIT
mmetsp:Transcript_25787/g.60460  ORF Transcript_25787/g.60460 Transcript_25787/m.60460 type:complete len:605 (+) Transcript_25787:59-1873(+)